LIPDAALDYGSPGDTPMTRTIALTVLVLSTLVLACGGGRARVSAGPMPTGGTFTGVWSSPQYGEMQMVQTGNAVVGEYHRDERSGRIQGTANGDLLRFEWREERELVQGRPTITTGRGYFRYSIDEAGKHNILGEWGIDDSETGGGEWNAYKLQNRRVSVQQATSGSEETDDWDDTGDTGGDDLGGGGGGDGMDDSGGGGGGGDVDVDNLDL
jgi:hypothetical protein